ncbi:hypothetical protein BFP70_03600 [Thioclava sp. SK-1]|nr:hypothetical protein BFP70_03600 [Thioclava sp. SK-1]
MIFPSIANAFEDLLRPGALKILLKGIALAIALLFAMTVVVVWGVGLFLPDQITLPFTGYTITWVDNILSFAIVGMMMVLSVVLMFPVASIFTGFFLEDVAEMVEGAHYPGLPEIRRFTLAETLGDSLRFMGVIVVANLLALLIYPFVIPLAPFLFFGLNGYLLGREYFQMAAARRMQREQVRQMYLRHKMTIWMTGALMAVPLSIPFVNLCVPVLGAAAFTHLFHRLEGRRPAPLPAA